MCYILLISAQSPELTAPVIDCTLTKGMDRFFHIQAVLFCNLECPCRSTRTKKKPISSWIPGRRKCLNMLQPLPFWGEGSKFHIQSLSSYFVAHLCSEYQSRAVTASVYSGIGALYCIWEERINFFSVIFKKM